MRTTNEDDLARKQVFSTLPEVQPKKPQAVPSREDLSEPLFSSQVPLPFDRIFNVLEGVVGGKRIE